MWRGKYQKEKNSPEVKRGHNDYRTLLRVKSPGLKSLRPLLFKPMTLESRNWNLELPFPLTSQTAILTRLQRHVLSLWTHGSSTLGHKWGSESTEWLEVPSPNWFYDQMVRALFQKVGDID